MSEEEADRAADNLDSILRNQPWFISSGVGETPSGFAIFVYSKNASGPKTQKLEQGWMGFPVIVRVTGKIRRVAGEQSAA